MTDVHRRRAACIPGPLWSARWARRAEVDPVPITNTAPPRGVGPRARRSPPPPPPEAVTALHPADLAALLGRRQPQAAWEALAALPLARRAETFSHLAPATRVAVAAVAPPPHLAELVSAMDADERADLWARLPEEMREALAPALAAAEREDIRRLASYPPGTARAMMTSEYAVLRPELTAREAIEALRR